MPRRKHTTDVALLEDAPPSPAERQAEMERILKLLPGTLDPEKVALRARARDAHEFLWIHWMYRVCEVETYDGRHPTQQRKGEKE